MSLEFEWDLRKAARNVRVHGVSFQEAATVFEDELSATVVDPDHSEQEDRFITIGTSVAQRLLIVSHTEREDKIRIISARELTSREREQYEENF
jgi:uncharacterized protein